MVVEHIHDFAGRIDGTPVLIWPLSKCERIARKRGAALTDVIQWEIAWRMSSQPYTRGGKKSRPLEIAYYKDLLAQVAGESV